MYAIKRLRIVCWITAAISGIYLAAEFCNAIGCAWWEIPVSLLGMMFKRTVAAERLSAFLLMAIPLIFAFIGMALRVVEKEIAEPSVSTINLIAANEKKESKENT